jgi:hypothetical protein
VTLLRPPAFVREVHKPMGTGTNGAPLAPALRLAAVPDEVDWEVFSKLYFPERRRHDLEALASYAAYKRGGRWGASGDPFPNLTLVQSESVPPARESGPERVAAQRLRAAIAAVHV